MTNLTMAPIAERVRAVELLALPTLQELPTRRPEAPPEPGSSLRWEPRSDEGYVVRAGRQVIGFIDVVGAVFVVLQGPRYDRAVEIGQTLIFDNALAALSDGSAELTLGA